MMERDEAGRDPRPESMDPAGREGVYESLVYFGAPLLGHRSVKRLTLEETLARALELARENPTVLRILPVVLATNADRLDTALLLAEADRRGQSRPLGMLLELTGQLAGRETLLRLADRIARRFEQPEFFYPPRGRFDARLAQASTPPVARRWGFIVNMPEDSFRAVLRKHLG